MSRHGRPWTRRIRPIFFAELTYGASFCLFELKHVMINQRDTTLQWERRRGSAEALSDRLKEAEEEAAKEVGGWEEELGWEEKLNLVLLFSFV